MVVFYLRNSKAPNGKIAPVTVSLTQEAILPGKTESRSDQVPVATGTGLPNLFDPESNLIWLLTVSTVERDSSGNRIPTEFINLVSRDTIHLELEAALGRLGKKIDWGDLLQDTHPPKLISITPDLNQTENVSINKDIIVRLKDPLPAAGMDLSSLNMTLNGFPVVTSGVVEPGRDVEFKGNVFDLTIIHRPERIT